MSRAILDARDLSLVVVHGESQEIESACVFPLRIVS